MNAPPLLQTDRLSLRPWRGSDARELGEILAVNYEHLGPWIPSRIATPAPAAVLEMRMQTFADDFDGATEWRYAMFGSADDTLLGEISLFPRSVGGRVPYADSDRLEIGYWIRKDMTGQGFVTEAVRAVLAIVSADPRFSCVEIRCDARNAPSSAVPARLGFTLSRTVADGDVTLQIWTLPLTAKATE